MSDPIEVLLKFAFLAVLYLFLLWVARSALRDLRRPAPSRRGSRTRERPRPASPVRRAPGRASSGGGLARAARRSRSARAS